MTDSLRCLQLVEPARPLFLDVAESIEQRKIVIVRALPGLVILRSPQAPVVRRSRIGKQRYGIIGPNAGILHLGPPALDDDIIVLRHLDQVGLYERDVSLGGDEPIG